MNDGFLWCSLLVPCCWVGKWGCCTFRHKKTWSPTVVVLRFEAVALPNVLEQQREAHADMLFYTPRDDAHIYTSPRRLVYNKPVGHLPLLSSEYILETATFLNVRTKRYNKRLFSIK